GDLVGYAPWPNETVARLWEQGIAGVAGNYDSTVATDYAHCGCRYEDPAQEANSHLSYAWTRTHVSPETKARLGTLPFRLDLSWGGGHASGPRVILVHGTPTLNTLYWTEDRPDDFNQTMVRHAGARPGDLIAFGHTHKPWIKALEGVRLVNAGSVGRPKDGDWRAAYALVTLARDGLTAELVRVEYDLDRAVHGIVASELPHRFAEELQ